ncbi:Crp/Fnr family transcriptional regulator [Tropicimonas sp. IMCC34043]|uniref:Crp/Fnr family transcriptional regulator n=1 Tax=Tropicimonas sp. IMCC34043 TaxID=2248760 RepID=UPI0013004861|nr:cyclic nucleotide-binding domain-containing protein [Tropicimonas sp. IMCC34043]
MELTLTSAMSGGAMVGHLSYLLLVVSMMMQSMLWLRLLVILSSLLAIAYEAVWLHDPVGLFWESALVVVNLLQIARLWYRSRVARFLPEDRLLAETVLQIRDPALARSLLDGGFWTDLPEGSELVHQGQPPSHLTFLASGAAGVRRDGATLAEVGPGAFVGEMSIFDPEGMASATVVVSRPVRCWRISFERLRHWQRAQPDLSAAIEAGLARDMRQKIVAGNARMTAAQDGSAAG